MTIRTVLRDLEQGKPLAPIYALVGEETFMIEQALSALREKAVGEGGIPGFNEDVFHGKETTGATVAAAASTLPMMSDRRFVLVRHLEAVKSELDALVAYVKKPSPSTCLVMTATKLNGSTKLAKALKKAGFRHDAKALKGDALRAFISDEADRAGNPIAADAAYALTEAIGSDLSTIGDAIERLSLYVGPGQRIDKKAVEACVTRVRVDSIWALVDAVSLRDRTKALRAATSLLHDREPPLKILSLLARQLRMVARMRDGLGQGLTAAEAARAAGAPPFKARDLKEAARRFRLDDLSRAFRTLAETDLLLKGSKQPGDVALQHAIMRLAGP